MRRIARLAAAGLIAVSSAVTGQGARLAVLDHLSPGNWTLHEIGSTGSDRSLCISEPGLLLQIHHGAATCARFVVSSDPRSATIHYTCPGEGHGRTTLTNDGTGALRIHTQGLAAGAPFDMDYEARRGGPCTGPGRN